MKRSANGWQKVLSEVARQEVSARDSPRGDFPTGAHTVSHTQCACHTHVHVHTHTVWASHTHTYKQATPVINNIMYTSQVHRDTHTHTHTDNKQAVIQILVSTQCKCTISQFCRQWCVLHQTSEVSITQRTVEYQSVRLLNLCCRKARHLQMHHCKPDIWEETVQWKIPQLLPGHLDDPQRTIVHVQQHHLDDPQLYMFNAILMIHSQRHLKQGITQPLWWEDRIRERKWEYSLKVLPSWSC